MSGQTKPTGKREIHLPAADSKARPLSVDHLLDHSESAYLIEEYGRTAVISALSEELAAMGDTFAQERGNSPYYQESVLLRATERLRKAAEPALRCVFNLTGTIVHPHLGRALLPEEAVRALSLAAAEPCNLELDLELGRRGDRDGFIEKLVREITGAEAAVVVNNNAAAVLLALNTLALRKEVIVSRGELAEIGDSFRIPEMISRAGCKLREVGTTNRTHLNDFVEAVGPRTRLLLKVHTSNYAVQGHIATVPEEELSALAHKDGLVFMVDLGSGTLVDLEQWGLPHEPTVQGSLAHGADLVTFSGDKLFGGPQAGIIAGKAELIARIKKNPLKRALRVDKITLAALEAVLQLYRNPDRLPERLPTLRLLTRSIDDISALAERLQPELAARVGANARVTIESCSSQIGSALPVERLESVALAITPTGKQSSSAVQRLDLAFRQLPMPVIGKISGNALWLDLRCLEDEASFVEQLVFLFDQRLSPRAC